jgi:phage N-6-adenine-methyltransferase
VYFSSKKEEWTTPPDLFAKLDDEFGFTLDVAATHDNTLCPSYFTRAENGLVQEWTGTVWCNPPYNRKVGAWIQKAYESSLCGATVVVLIASRTSNVWWHAWVENKAEVRFLPKRLKFGNATSGAPFPSALLIFRPLQDQREDRCG